ncbi:MAG: hypothetical protein HRT91_03360 [Piscirickettsiaceae bacterium]|nr:hypothetical protein [Piscirickettsiaceae bacterium]
MDNLLQYKFSPLLHDATRLALDSTKGLAELFNVDNDTGPRNNEDVG